METVTRQEAQRLVKWCVCSDCWGHLTEFLARDEAGKVISLVHCQTPGCQCRGFVSAKFAERRLAESQAERSDVVRALRSAVPWMSNGDVKKITKELY